MATRPYRAVKRFEEIYNVVKCGNCGFVFVRDPPISTTLNSAPRADKPMPPAPRHYHIQRLLQRLCANPAQGQVVEIGVGLAQLASLLHKNFDYLGFEPSAHRASRAKSLGFPVRQTLFSPDELPGGVDAVVLDNVLEHVLDPNEMIADISRALKPEGILVVIVPNRHDLRRLHSGWRRRHFWTPPHHINYFSQGDMTRLLVRHKLVPRPFGLSPLRLPRDVSYLPRAASELLGQSCFGLNLYARKSA